MRATVAASPGLSGLERLADSSSRRYRLRPRLSSTGYPVRRILDDATGDARPRASSARRPGSRATVAASPGLSGLERLAASSHAATGYILGLSSTGYPVRRILDDGLGLADLASKGGGERRGRADPSPTTSRPGLLPPPDSPPDAAPLPTAPP